MNNPLSAAQLEFLVRLYEEGNLSRASRALGLTQSKGSRMLSELRRVFKDELFIKSNDGMVPTERCQRLMPRIGQNLSGLDALIEDEAAFSPKTLRKTFRLGIVDNAFYSMLLPILDEIQNEAPSVNFVIPEINFRERYELLSANAVDLLIYPSTGEPVPPNIRSIRLFEEHFVYVTRKGHPLEKARGGDISALVSDYPRSGFSYDKKSVSGQSYEEKEAGGSYKFFLKSPFFVTSLLACLGSDLVGLAPKRTVEMLAQWLPLSFYETPGFNASPIYPTLYWHESKNADTANQWLRSHIVSGCAAGEKRTR